MQQNVNVHKLGPLAGAKKLSARERNLRKLTKLLLVNRERNRERNKTMLRGGAKPKPDHGDVVGEITGASNSLQFLARMERILAFVKDLRGKRKGSKRGSKRGRKLGRRTLLKGLTSSNFTRGENPLVNKNARGEKTANRFRGFFSEQFREGETPASRGGTQQRVVGEPTCSEGGAKNKFLAKSIVAKFGGGRAASTKLSKLLARKLLSSKAKTNIKRLSFLRGLSGEANRRTKLRPTQIARRLRILNKMHSKDW